MSWWRVRRPDLCRSCRISGRSPAGRSSRASIVWISQFHVVSIFHSFLTVGVGRVALWSGYGDELDTVYYQELDLLG